MSGRFENGERPDANGVRKLKKPFEIAEILAMVSSTLKSSDPGVPNQASRHHG
jgi:hypothetical protein